MDITWEEFQAIAAQLDDVTQLRIMNAVLTARNRKLLGEHGSLIEQLMNLNQTIERLEEDLRSSNGQEAQYQ